MIVTAHDLYELVVGDGDYHRTTFKVSTGNNQGMNIIPNTEGDRKSIFSEGDLRPGEEINLILDQKLSSFDDGSYEVNLKIRHLPKITGGPEKIFATYNFNLPPNMLQSATTTLWLSIGLLAAKDRSKVAIDFTCFEIKSP